MSYGIRGTTTAMAGEGGDAPITAVKAWMERIPELIKGHLSDDILKMDELGLFVKRLLQKSLVEKEKKGRNRKQTKKRCTIVLFVAANGSQVCDPACMEIQKASLL